MVRGTPATSWRPASSFTPRCDKRGSNSDIKRLLEFPEIFVEHTQSNYNQEGQEERGARGDVPLGENDARVDYLGVPA